MNPRRINPPTIQLAKEFPLDLKKIGKKAAEKAEREHIKNTLIYTNWNRKAAARLLQVSYKALLYKIEKYALNRLSDDQGSNDPGVEADAQPE